MKAIFTRYLYFKEEVEDSLIYSILDKFQDESFFWAYELYFSGFQYEVFSVLDEMYLKFFREKISNTKSTYLNDLINKWEDDHNKHYILGDIINVLLNLDITLTAILRDEYTQNDLISNEIFPNGLIEENIIQYYTINASDDLVARKILERACRYKIRKQTCKYIGLVGFTIKEKYCENWLYFANKSPIWNERIEEYHGIIDRPTLSIIFENDENEISFYKKYDYDPDEQSSLLKSKIWCSEPNNALSWFDFYNTYSSDKIHSKVIKKKVF